MYDIVLFNIWINEANVVDMIYKAERYNSNQIRYMLILIGINEYKTVKLSRFELYYTKTWNKRFNHFCDKYKANLLMSI